MNLNNGDMPAMPTPKEEKQYVGTDFEGNPQYLNPKTEFTGLTKREQFAVMAMQGFISRGDTDISEIAEGAVYMANALLKELEK